MADLIVQKPQSKETNKNDLELDSETTQDCTRRLLEPMDPRAAGYLPGIGSHFIKVLETMVLNLSRLHEDLSEIERMLVKGGER